MMKSMQQLRAKVSSGERGFTLVELLIVVAIIGILAAIAIPQFAAYRIRAFNSSASSDARNSRTAEESAFVDFQVYAHTDGANTVLPGAGGFGAGTLFVGPMGPANTATAGAKLTTMAGVPAVAVGVGIGVGNLVGLIAHTDAVGSSFIALSKHQNGDTAYGADSDSTALYFVRNPAWIGAAQLLGDANVNGPGAPVAAVAGADDFNGVAGGGVPIANWSAQ